MSHPPRAEDVTRGPSVGPVCVSVAHWARHHFSGIYHPWHVVVGLQAACGRQTFDDPRVEWATAKPESGRFCKFCVAKFTEMQLSEKIGQLGKGQHA